MKTSSWFFTAVCMLALSGCAERLDYNAIENDEADRINQYTTAWVKKFGPIDPNQNWCMLQAVNADIAINAMGGTTVQVYNRAPKQGGHLIGVAHSDSRLVLDIPKYETEVYALITDEGGNILSEGTYDVKASAVRIDGNATPVPEDLSRYAHGDTNWFDAMVVCEDLGSIGDFDFNDVVLGLRHIAGTKTLEIMPMAAGGTMPVTIKFDGTELGEIHSMLAGDGASTSDMINTTSYSIKGATYNVTVDEDFSIAKDWSLLSLVVNDGSKAAYTITANSKGTSNVAPQVICLGGDWYWPTETTDITESYHNFTSWTNNANVQSWCVDYSDISLVVPWGLEDVCCYFVGSTSGGTFSASVNDGTVSSPVEVTPDTPYYTSAPTTCENMFNPNYNTLTLDMSHFDVSRVTNMSGMFRENPYLTNIDFGTNWDASHVTDMSYMFYNCQKLTDAAIANIGDWSVTTEPINMKQMFQWCKQLTDIDLSSWKAKPTSLQNTFYECLRLKNLNLDNLDLSLLGTSTTSISTPWNSMLMGCKRIENLSLKNWKIPSGLSVWWALTLGYDWGEEMYDTDVTYDCSGWDCTLRSGESTSGEVSLYQLFKEFIWVTYFNVSDWNTTGVKNMNGMFFLCTRLSDIIGLDSWDVSSVQDMGSMFSTATKITSLNLSHWDTSSLTSVREMFYSCSALQTLYIDNFNLEGVTETYYKKNMFQGVNANLKIRCSAATKQWLLDNADTIALPTALRSSSSPNWL